MLSGIYQARAAAQFGVFHPQSGPDAFPNKLGFTPEKLQVQSSYKPPTRLFENGRVIDIVVAGEPVQVAPNRSDTTDSVGFYFPRKRLLVTNFMVPGGIFNVYTLRGGPYRNPTVFIQDARWLEARNAEILLDIHGPTVKGENVVRDAGSMIRRCGRSPTVGTQDRRPSVCTCLATCVGIGRTMGKWKAM